MKLKNYSLILLMGMSSSAFALNVYNKDGNTLDIYGRVEGKIASGQNSFAGSESRSDLGGRIGIYLRRDVSKSLSLASAITCSSSNSLTLRSLIWR